MLPCPVNLEQLIGEVGGDSQIKFRLGLYERLPDVTQQLNVTLQGRRVLMTKTLTEAGSRCRSLTSKRRGVKARCWSMVRNVAAFVKAYVWQYRPVATISGS